MEPPIRARDVFYNYYASLTNILGYDVDNLLPELIAQRVISVNDKIIIEKTVSPSEKAGKLLNIVSGPLDAGSQASFEKMLQVMANGIKEETRGLAIEIMKEAGITPIINPKKYPKAVTSSAVTTHMKPRIKDISNLVVPFVTDKWEKICVQLLGDEHRHVMTTIRKDYHGNSEEGCDAMFRQWLDLCPNASWDDLINALRANSVRKIALAEELVQHVAKLSTAPVVSPTQPISPKQQHGGSHGADQLVTNRKEPEVKCGESVEATDGGTGGGHEPVIVSQASATDDCGKGTVTDAILGEAKTAVCRIQAPQTVGTGFIGYTPYKDKYITVLVTASHVIPTHEDAKASRITFENILPDNKKIFLKGYEIFTGGFWSNAMLDYSILEVNEDKTNELDIQPIHLLQPANIKDGDQVYVIQHTRGGHGCQAFSSSETLVKSPYLYYRCNTEKGSLGSPVLKEVNGELKIVAIHQGSKDGHHKHPGYNCSTLIQEIHLDAA